MGDGKVQGYVFALKVQVEVHHLPHGYLALSPQHM